MSIHSRTSVAIATLLAAALVTGCGGEQPTQSGTDATDATSFIGRQAAKGIAEAQRKLETENVRLGKNHRIHINGQSFGWGEDEGSLPRAEITPDGELLIAGEAVPANADQRELLLDYRGQLLGLTSAGMAVGIQGAEIAGAALTGVGQALFGGEEGRREFEARIEAQAQRVKQEAAAICTLLPALHDSQQALAAAMPEFAPYATMRREDIEDCGQDADPNQEPAHDIHI